MHRPEPTKERVERKTLVITAIEIPHSTRFTLLWAKCRAGSSRCGAQCKTYMRRSPLSRGLMTSSCSVIHATTFQWRCFSKISMWILKKTAKLLQLISMYIITQQFLLFGAAWAVGIVCESPIATSMLIWLILCCCHGHLTVHRYQSLSSRKL